MHKNGTKELLYDHMPKPDVKVPPISNSQEMQEDSKRMIDLTKKDEDKDLLSNLTFN